MTKKMYLGIAALIVFMIAAGGFIYWNVSTVQQMKEQAAQFEKMIEKIDKPVIANEPPPAAPGKKWVPHGDHFHEVPIDAPDVWQGEPHDTHASHQNVTPVQVASGTPDTSISAAVAVSDDVPKYAALKAMSDDELITLYEESTAKMAQLSPKLSEHMSAWTQASEGSEQQKRLRKAMDAVAWEYNVHAITSKKAFQVFHRRFIDELSELPDHPALMKFHPLPDNLVD